MPLVPPQAFRKIEFIHRIGLSADKPDPEDVLIGTLYFSTDTGVIERSNGTSWESYAASVSVTDPLFVSTVIGGTGTTSTLTLQSTSGVGGSTSNVIIKVGNNGSIKSARFRSDALKIPVDNWITGELSFNPDPDRNIIRRGLTGATGYNDHVEINCGADAPITAQDNNLVWFQRAAFNQYIEVGAFAPGSPTYGELYGVNFGKSNDPNSRGRLTMPSSGVLKMIDGGDVGAGADSDFNRLQFGGSASTFPALKRNTVILETKLADDSAYTQHTVKQLGVVDSVTAPATQAGKALIYVDSADSDLKVKYGSGTVKSLTTSQDTFLTNTDTGTKTAWAPGIVGNTSLHWSGASDIIIQGITSGVAGLKFEFKNTGSKWAWFTHASGSASAADRLTNLATSSLTAVAPGGWIRYQHDGTNWKLIDHEQGASITSTYSSSHYTAAAGAWTVDSGDVSTFTWKLEGKFLHINIALTTTSFSGGTNVFYISNGAYGGWIIAKTTTHPSAMVYETAAAVYVPAYLQMIASDTFLSLVKQNLIAYPVVTNGIYVNGTITVEVT